MTTTASIHPTTLRLLNLDRPKLELFLLVMLTLTMSLFAGLPSHGVYELMLEHGLVVNYPQFVLIWMTNGVFWAFTFLPVLSFQVDKDRPFRSWITWSNWAKTHSLLLAACYYGSVLECVKGVCRLI